MPPRSYWKGYLKLSLVTCPVQMMPATTDRDRIRFRTLNRDTGHPVTSRWIDSGTGKPVEPDDLVKGYPRGEDDYVLLEEEELDAVALDSTRTIDIQTFVRTADIGWIWYDSPHYLMPSDPVGEEAFAVIRAAMEATGRAGISRLVMGGRERAVLLVPRLRGIVLWTLRFGDEVRDPSGLFDKAEGADPDPAMLDMIGKLIEARTGDWRPEIVHDPVQDRLRDLIEARKKAKPAPKKGKDTPPPRAGNVISLMEALKKSVQDKPPGGTGAPKGGAKGGRGKR